MALITSDCAQPPGAHHRLDGLGGLAADAPRPAPGSLAGPLPPLSPAAERAEDEAFLLAEAAAAAGPPSARPARPLRLEQVRTALISPPLLCVCFHCRNTAFPLRVFTAEPVPKTARRSQARPLPAAGGRAYEGAAAAVVGGGGGGGDGGGGDAAAAAKQKVVVFGGLMSPVLPEGPAGPAATAERLDRAAAIARTGRCGAEGHLLAQLLPSSYTSSYAEGQRLPSPAVHAANIDCAPT